MANDFMLGCNYWASHAGMYMWRRWDEQTVRADLAVLAQHGIDTIRIFPLWPDFQPLEQVYEHMGHPIDILSEGRRLKEADTGIDQEMVQRFRTVCDIAREDNINVVPALVTGWMSGQLFVPPALVDKRLLEDPFCIRWTVKYVTALVRLLKDHPAITFWDVGNEYVCLGKCRSPESFWLWVHTITTAIRSADPSRRIISGNHGMSVPYNGNNYEIGLHGECVDIMTTHPYPPFTPYCGHDPLGSPRSLAHAVAEGQFYGGIAGKPNLCEECGNLGDMHGDQQTASFYFACLLRILWAHGDIGLFWWCAYDILIEESPYDHLPFEGELGLFDNQRRPKAMALALKEFAQWLHHADRTPLPARHIDAVCLLPDGAQAWGQTLGAWILSKQVNLDIAVRRLAEPDTWPDADLYLLPSLMHRPTEEKTTVQDWKQLMQRIENGATLYLSSNGAYLRDFEKLTGLRVINRSLRANDVIAPSAGHTLNLGGKEKYHHHLQPIDAEIILSDQDGAPLMTRHPYGQGTVFYLDVGIETELAARPQGFDQPGLDLIYRTAAAEVTAQRWIHSADAGLMITEHHLNDHNRYAVLTATVPEEKTYRVTLTQNISITAPTDTQPEEFTLLPGQTVVWTLQKK